MATEFEPVSVVTHDHEGSLQFVRQAQLDREQALSMLGPDPHRALDQIRTMDRKLDDRARRAGELRIQADSLVRLYASDPNDHMRSQQMARAARLYKTADAIQYPTLGGEDAFALRQHAEHVVAEADSQPDDGVRSEAYRLAAALLRQADAIQYPVRFHGVLPTA